MTLITWSSPTWRRLTVELTTAACHQIVPRRSTRIGVRSLSSLSRVRINIVLDWLIQYSYPCLDKNKWIISKKRSWDVYHLYHISDEKSIVQRPSKGNISEWALSDNFPPQPRGSNIEPFSVLANFNHTGVNWYIFLYGWKNWVPRHA